MPFYQAGSIKYYRFESLEVPGMYHAFYTRRGGSSPTPWKSLNFGGSVGDRPERVRQNREKALSALDIDPQCVYDTYQVHSNEVVVTDQPMAQGQPHVKADAIITNQPRLTLMMRFADCVPIMLFDPVKGAIGIAHAGWMGTVTRIASKTVEAMRQKFGTDAKDIVAAIGPSIGPDHYFVQADVIEKFRSNFGEAASELITTADGKETLDLWKANRLVLSEAGVRQIEIAGLCTHCNLEDWYSHRGEHGKTGRFGAVLGLE